jgi:hypothetical protein
MRHAGAQVVESGRQRVSDERRAARTDQLLRAGPLDLEIVRVSEIVIGISELDERA